MNLDNLRLLKMMMMMKRIQLLDLMNKQMEMDNKGMMMIQVWQELQLDEENYHQLLDKIIPKDK
jgi:orotate phosphoribosyltransferase-like protein